MEDKIFKYACVLGFCGESGSGKSTMAHLVKACLEEKGLKAEFATKYIKGRPQREKEDPNTKIVDTLPENCIVGSPRSGVEIGYDLDEIKQMLNNGIFPIVITKDIKFLATLTSTLNPTTTSDLQPYRNRMLPVMRTRIYDVRSTEMSENDIVKLTHERHPGMSDADAKKEAHNRVESWQKYYRERSGYQDFVDAITNIKTFDKSLMKRYLAKYVVGELNEDEDTILGYTNLWKQNTYLDTTGVILGKYDNLALSSLHYLERQAQLDEWERLDGIPS